MIYPLIGFVTGLLIGTVGVGGILLAPLLVYLTGMELQPAMATASWSFLFTGVAGTIAYARRDTIRWRPVAWLSLGILPAAPLGAWVNSLLSSGILTLLLAVLIVASGLNALRNGPAPEAGSQAGPAGLLLTGSAIGFGSALTGTGGPVLWLPLAALFKVPPLVAVGVSQAIQLPIAALATVGFYLFGEIDFALGVVLGLSQSVAVVIGARIAHMLSAARMRQSIALALVGAGMLMILRSLL
jgi:uncharacterized membrane protein YfcA